MAMPLRAGCPSSLGRSIISVAAGNGVAGCLEKTEHRVWKSEEKAPFEKQADLSSGQLLS